MRLLVCLVVLALVSVVSAPVLLADTIYVFYRHSDSVSLSSGEAAWSHPVHGSSFFSHSSFLTNTLFFPDFSSLTSPRHDYLLHADSLDNEDNNGLHLGWGNIEHPGNGLHLGWGDVEHHGHHHSNVNGAGVNDPPADAVSVPEPSTFGALLSGLAVILFASSRRKSLALRN